MYHTGYFVTGKETMSQEELFNHADANDLLDIILYKLSQLIPATDFAVSGNYAISKMIPKPYRRVMELDILVPGAKTVLAFVKALPKLCMQLAAEGFIDKYDIMTADAGPRDGVRCFKHNTRVFSLEVSEADISWGITAIKIGGQEINITTPERCLADKLRSSWSDRRARRASDFYDIYKLISTLKLSAEDIVAALDAVNFKPGSVVAFTEQELFEIRTTYSKYHFKDGDGKSLKLPSITDIFLLYGEFCLPLHNYWASGEHSELGTWHPDDLIWDAPLRDPLTTKLLWGTLVGPSSLAVNSLTTYDNVPITLLASKREMDSAVFGPFQFIYVPRESDDSNFQRFPLKNWRVPTVEKAISDYMQSLSIFDDELLVEAIADFIRKYSKDDVERLKSYCSVHGSSDYMISQYFADAQSIVDF